MPTTEPAHNPRDGHARHGNCAVCSVEANRVQLCRFSLSDQIADLTETLTRPRFHTFCGETHAPGPCNDGVTRTEPTDG